MRLHTPRRLSLRAVLRSLPDSQDLFPAVVDLSSLQAATELYLAGRESRENKFHFLSASADRLAARGFPQHAALLMEAVGRYMIRTAQDSGKSTVWQEGFQKAATFWLIAGNPEGSEDALLMSAGLALGSKLQLPLFADASNGRHLQPLWVIAADFDESGKHEDAAKAYDRLTEELTLFQDFVGAAISSVLAARSYAQHDCWADVIARSERTIEMCRQDPRLADVHRLKYIAHIQAGIGYLNVRPDSQVESAILRLRTAWDLSQTHAQEVEQDEEERNRLTRLLGAAHAIRGERQLDSWYANSKTDSLRAAENDFAAAVSFFELTSPLPVVELGRACALLTVVHWHQGDRVKAAEWRKRALLYGCDPYE